MAIGIIGLPLSGKTTIFNAVTRGHATVAGHRVGGAQPNIGVAKVPDPRLQVLAKLSHPRKIVPAEVQYVDIPSAPEGLGKSQGIGGEFLVALQRCEVLLLVARMFEDAAVPHGETAIDPYRDVATLQSELAFSDLALLERREQRIQGSLRAAKASERDALLREAGLLRRVREALDRDVPVREQQVPAEARPLLENFQLLTAKPLVVMFNIGEADLSRASDIEREMTARLGRPHVATAALCGKLEMELAQIAPEEEAEMRAGLGAGEPGLDRMIRLSYGLLGLISFLTTGEDETRAWTINRGMTALLAAGRVHSDIQRGFIRAEVVAYDDLVRAGGLAEARRLGLLRAEGKQYIMQDGDVVNYLFNV